MNLNFQQFLEMKSIHASKHQKAIKTSWFRYALLCAFLVAIAFGIAHLKSSKPQQAATKLDPTEQYILAKLINQDVTPSAWPALIYKHAIENSPGVFMATGTVLNEKNENPILFTAEHIFRTDHPVDRILSVKVLRAEEMPTLYVREILGTSETLKGGDLLKCRLGTEPVIIKPFSKYHKTEGGYNYWAPVEIGGDKIEWMLSVLSGEKAKTIGYYRRVVGDKSDNFVLIDYLVKPGESGTGFVDPKGGLWVVHGMPVNQKTLVQVAEECYQRTGIRIQYPCAVSGPLGGQYTNSPSVK